MAALADLCELIIDCEHKTAPTGVAGFPLIRTPDIGFGRLNVEGANRVDEATYRAWTQRAVPRAGDLILAREAPVGNVGPVPPGVQPVLGQRTVLIRTRPEVLDPIYLNYLLCGPELRNWMLGVASGATLPHLNMADIRSMELPSLPSPEAQRKIAAILAAYDNLIDNNNRRIKVLEEVAQRIYREWFVDFRYPGHERVPLVDSEVGPIPDGWSSGLLGDEVEFVYGKALTADARQDGSVIVFGSGGVIGQHDEALSAGPGIVVGRKGNVGAVHWSDGPFFAIDTTYWVRSELPLTYCYFALRDLEFLDSHAAVPGLSRAQAYALPLVCPSRDVLETFDGLVADLFALRARWAAATTNLRATRDVLLPRLVSGAIDVTDLNIGLSEFAA
jgi:type I restriction enzyme S subunit